jgi:3-hydroxyisobutyrate dehydrogenase
MAVIGGAEKGPAALTLLYREEAAGAAQGLDWSRAANLYEDHFHEDHGNDDDEDDEGEMFGFTGGFGGYSTN